MEIQTERRKLLNAGASSRARTACLLLGQLAIRRTRK